MENGRLNKIILTAHMINLGYAEGEAIVSREPFSFIGKLNPITGKVPSPKHELFGQILTGKILVCPTGKGASGAPNVDWLAKKVGNIPKAIICSEAEPVIAAAAIIADILMLDRLEQDPLEVIKNGDYVKIDATKGMVEIVPKSKR